MRCLAYVRVFRAGTHSLSLILNSICSFRQPNRSRMHGWAIVLPCQGSLLSSRQYICVQLYTQVPYSIIDLIFFPPWNVVAPSIPSRARCWSKRSIDQRVRTRKIKERERESEDVEFVDCQPKSCFFFCLNFHGIGIGNMGWGEGVGDRTNPRREEDWPWSHVIIITYGFWVYRKRRPLSSSMFLLLPCLLHHTAFISVMSSVMSR